MRNQVLDEGTSLARRDMLRSLALTPLALAAGAQVRAASVPEAVRSADLPLTDPAFNVRTLGRLQGDLSGQLLYSYSSGTVFGLIPGEGLAPGEYGRALYRVEGCSVKRSRLRADGAVEDRSRSWMLYRDADTREYLDEYLNPYTGERVKVPVFRGGIGGTVMTVKGPEVRASFTMESTVFGKPPQLDYRFIGDRAWIARSAFTRWKESSSGTLRTEMTLDTWNCATADLANATLTHVPSAYSWTSQTEWQSWLNMRGRPGAMLWRNEGMKFDSIAALPRDFVMRSEQVAPGRLTEPLDWEA